MAETLITLTIIGVIAAITVPTLLHKYQEQIYLTGLKKAYSNLQNAYKMIPLAEGCPAGDYECAGLKGTGYNMFFNSDDLKIISKQFKTQKYFETGEEIINFYKESGYENNDIYISAENQDFLAEDGILYYSASMSAGIWVDTNGVKGPNKMCKDIFKFHVVPFDYQNSWYTQRKNIIIKAGTIIPDHECTYEFLFKND